MIKHSTPTKEFAEYTITQEQRSEIERLALKVNQKSSDGTYWLNECFTNVMRLTPRHVSENFKNVRISLGFNVYQSERNEFEKFIENGGDIK